MICVTWCHNIRRAVYLVGNGRGDEEGEELAGAGGDRTRVRGVARLLGGRPGSPHRIVEVPHRDRAQAHEGAVASVLRLCLKIQELKFENVYTIYRCYRL